jgi:hypothetical protein
VRAANDHCEDDRQHDPGDQGITVVIQKDHGFMPPSYCFYRRTGSVSV